MMIDDVDGTCYKSLHSCKFGDRHEAATGICSLSPVTHQILNAVQITVVWSRKTLSFAEMPTTVCYLHGYGPICGPAPVRLVNNCIRTTEVNSWTTDPD